MKIKKIFKLTIFTAITLSAVFSPLSVYRDCSEIVLVKNVIFAAKATKKPVPVKKAVPVEEKKEAAAVADTDKPKVEDSAAGTETKLPEAGEDATLYDYNRVEPDDSSTGWMFFKFFLIVALLLTGFYFFFRFVTKKAGMSVLGGNTVDIISAVPVGPNKFIHIVDVAGKMLVLGVTDSNINILTEITEKDQKDRIRLESSKSVPAGKATFQQYVETTAGFINEVVKKTSELSAAHKEKLAAKKHQQAEVNHESDVKREFTNYKKEDSPEFKRTMSKREDNFSEYIDDDKMNYLKKQKDRLKRLNGFDNE